MKRSSIAGGGAMVVAALCLALAGCGGGGSSSADATPGTTPVAKVLRWNPPQSFSDQTPLDPTTDLKEYLIFVNNTGTFSATDGPSAVASAVDPASGQATVSFDLANLSAFLSPGVTYYVSMQSVSITGVKSDFSPAASFTL